MIRCYNKKNKIVLKKKKTETEFKVQQQKAKAEQQQPYIKPSNHIIKLDSKLLQ